MKRILFALIVLGTVGANACPQPTSHGIIDFGGIAFFPGRFDAPPIGGFAFVGYETPKKWSTIGVQYCGIATNEHQIGIQHKLNIIPFWVGSPINLHILTGAGYLHKVNSIRDNYYANVGLEINFGQIYAPISFFLRDEVGFETLTTSFNPKLRNSVLIGIHIRLGSGL